MNNKINLYFNTIKYLKPSQMYFRVSNKVKRKLYEKNLISVKIPNSLVCNNGYDFTIPELDYEHEYMSRFNTNDILNNTFKFINITNTVNLETAWNDKDLQHLWRYNLHYFEYLFKLAHEYINNGQNDIYYNKFKELVENWIDNNPLPYGDGWHPYTISLRVTNWICVYEVFEKDIKKDERFNEKIIKSMYLQYKYLQKNLEKDVLGNHYFENIKALIIASIFFGEYKIKDKFKKELIIQLKEQILDDGMHFELSPMYHKIILEDLIKITYWLKEDYIHNELLLYIQQMVNVMYSLEDRFGKTPSFNDCADGISKSYKCILKFCEKYFNLKPKFNTNLESSGYYIIKDDDKKLIFDTGDICPKYLPAHGHCDALSFELSFKAKPIIVNRGTYKYENGQWRNYFRSTKSHSTVIVSKKEQSQCWSSFRVAKRIRNINRTIFEYRGIKFYAGTYKSFTGYKHKRYIGYINKHTMIVLDNVEVKSEDNIESYLHFNPEIDISITDRIININFEEHIINIIPIGTKSISIDKGWYSSEFNVKEENVSIKLVKDIDSLFFGYIISFDKNCIEISESNLELKIKYLNTEEVTIKYSELGEKL